jgi:hypothetical protein
LKLEPSSSERYIYRALNLEVSSPTQKHSEFRQHKTFYHSITLCAESANVHEPIGMASSGIRLFLLSLLGFALLAGAEVHEHEFIVSGPLPLSLPPSSEFMASHAAL